MMKLVRAKPVLALALGMGVAFAAGVAVAGQPHMQNALKSLRNARAQLESALADKAGHRVKAIALVDQAIAEVNAGIVAGAN
jgi:cytochrome bd-type quinol oxidase subunit 1